MEEAIPDVEEEAPDVFGIKKLETPKTCRAMAPRKFSTALPLPKKNWPPQAVRRTNNFVRLKDINQSSGVNIRIGAALAGITAIDERKYSDRGVTLVYYYIGTAVYFPSWKFMLEYLL